MIIFRECAINQKSTDALNHHELKICLIDTEKHPMIRTHLVYQNLINLIYTMNLYYEFHRTI